MIEAGFSEIEFTPAPGLRLVGQMHERRAASAHDPLCACAAAFRSSECCVVLISVDVCVLESGYVRETQRAFEARTGFPADSLLLHATHTHTAPAPVPLLGDEGDPPFGRRLRSAILRAADLALLRLEPVELISGRSFLEQLGWNRRAMFSDGTSRMYGHSELPGFIGMEGPRDPDLPVIGTLNRARDVTGVLTGFSTHPNCLESECFYGADIPGAVRRSLRSLCGRHIGVVYLTGAAGNTAPSMLDPYVPSQPWRGEGGLARSGEYIADEVLRVLADEDATARDADASADAILRHAQTTIRIPVRPWPEEDDPSYPRIVWKEACAYYERARVMWPRLEAAGPTEIPIHVVRIGDAAICTNPGELFVEFGLAIKEASPAGVTLVAELTDGYAGYVPTPLAFSRGGYETWPAPTSRLAKDAGDRIVDATRALLSAVFER